MMNRLFNYIIAMLVAVCALSCASNTDSVATTDTVKEIYAKNHEIIRATKTIARNLVETNAFIDVDIDAFDKTMRDNLNPTLPVESLDILEVHSEEFGQIQAAMYRFYNKVSTVDGQAYLSVKDASELNMSERTFNQLKESVALSNAQAADLRSRGFDVPKSFLPQEYINGLIDDSPRERK